MIIKKKESIFYQVDFAEKIEESKMIDKYLEFARKLKNLGNMQVTVLPIVVGALGTVPKSLKRNLEESDIWGTIEKIHFTALLLSATTVTRPLTSHH